MPTRVQAEQTQQFNIDPFFAGDTINIEDLRYFQHPKKLTKDGTTTIPNCDNRQIDNQLRYFLQHKVVDEHVQADRVYTIIHTFMYRFSRFINAYHLALHSITDISYEELLNEFVEYEEGLNHTTSEDFKYYVVNDSRRLTTKKGKSYSKCLSLLKMFYDFIKDVEVGPNEYDKDIWDVKKLGIPCNPSLITQRFTVNFTKIVQPWLRVYAKKYIYYLVPLRSVGTITNNMKMFNSLSNFLLECYPDMSSIGEMNREVTIKYIAKIKSSGLSSTTVDILLCALKDFFRRGYALEWDGFPNWPLVSYQDYEKRAKHESIPFTENELAQINEHLCELNIDYMRIVVLLESTGLRLYDALTATIEVDGSPCIKQIGEDEYLFRFVQHKIRQTTTLPVSPVIAETLKAAIHDSQDKYGQDSKFIFPRSKSYPIHDDTFIDTINKMSYDNNLIADDGKALRIKGHTFRRTLATDCVNNDYPLEVVRMLLGQSYVSSLTHYYVIHSDVMADKMSNIIEADNDRILNIGHQQSRTIEENDETSEMLPLSNGYCAKKIATGVCSHANACYSCSMFHPSISALPLYKKQLRDCELNITICRINHHERYLEVNEQLKTQLEDIISKLEAC
jgi:integrase